MLNPRSYPELVAKALVLDDEPFFIMAEDDNPWFEGLALTTLVSLLAGSAQAIGSFLTASSLPPPNAVLTTIQQGWSQLAVTLALPPAVADRLISQFWIAATTITGYSGGWTNLIFLAATPIRALLWWAFFGFLAFAVARTLGGRGSLTATLGAAALGVAPHILLLLSFVPFVSVNGALLAVWGMLIGYRAVQITHGLTWRRAAVATIIPYAAAVIVFALLAGAFAAGYSAGGFR